MYCVIQEIQLKKANPCGEYREMEAYSYFAINGLAKWAYRYTGGRFERPVKTAYKISIHESHRINGVVTKKQFIVATANYYNIVTDWFALGDYDQKLTHIAESLRTSADALYELICAKLDPLTERIKAEYRKTAEYKTHTKHSKIIAQYQRKKATFTETYCPTDASQYDYCYDVFGNVKNQGYIDQIIKAYQRRQEENRSYSGAKSSNHGDSGGTDYSKLSGFAVGDFTADERVMLKSFYKILSQKYHPDKNLGSDTTNAMQLVNKLKLIWGV